MSYSHQTKYFHYKWVSAPATDCDSSIMLPQRLAIERTGEGRFTPWSRRYSPSPPCSATATTGPQDLISFTGNLFQLRWFSGKKKEKNIWSEKHCQRYYKPKAHRIGHGVVGHDFGHGIGHSLGHAVAEVYPDEIFPNQYQYAMADNYFDSRFDVGETDVGC